MPSAPPPPWQVRPLASGEAAAAHAFLRAQGWAHRVGELAWFERLLAASQRVCVAQADGALVGFARGITDGLANGYLSMVVVAPAWRGHGIGRALVQGVVGEEAGVTWVLRAGREGAAGFFGRLGFRPSPVAMERPRAAP